MREPPDHIRLDILTDAMRKKRDVRNAMDKFRETRDERDLEEFEEEFFNLECLLDELSLEAAQSEDPYF
jgi:hypothetical protein